MKNPKAKGNNFEARTSKCLTKWASGKDKPLWYWRVGSSGAQATITKDVTSKMLGDVVAIHPNGSFLTDAVVIELKNVKTTNALDFISIGRETKVMRWWNKVKGEAEGAGREPWLIFHRHGSRKDYLVFSMSFFNKLVGFTGIKGEFIRVRKSTREGTLFIVELVPFLKFVPPWVLAWAFFGAERMNEVKDNYSEKDQRKKRKKRKRIVLEPWEMSKKEWL